MKPYLPVLVSSACLLTGCVMPKDTYRARQHHVTATHDIPDAIYAATEAEIAGNPALMDSARAEHALNKDGAKAEFDKVNARLRQTERELAALIDGLAKTAGVTPVAAAVATSVGSMIKQVTGVAEEGVKAADAAQKTADANASEQKASKDKIDAQLSRLNEILTAKAKELEDLQAEVKSSEKALNGRFAALDDQTKQQIKESLLTEFEKNGATKEELEKYRSMTPEQLYALLLAGGGTGIAALLRTMGKSRGQGEIDQLRNDTKNLQTDLAKMNQLQSDLQRLNQRQDLLVSKLDRFASGDSSRSG